MLHVDNWTTGIGSLVLLIGVIIGWPVTICRGTGAEVSGVS